MFTTHSEIPQLKPDTITKCVQVSEDHQWSLGDLASGQEGPQDGQELGTMLLGQSICMKKVHSFFSQLESRKCCLHLACRRSTFNSMRVVPASAVEDDGGSNSRHQSTTNVSYLDSKNLRTFKNAYMCAVYPVLATPELPITPSPAFLDPQILSKSGTYDMSCFQLSGRHASYSSHDSGVEEVDEAAVIPMETICEQLQRAFGLTKTLFHQYESLLVKAYAKKSPQRILAEEFAGQLICLETNCHPYYCPTHFLISAGYDLWQKQERSHISELLNKFWQYSLPFPVDHHDLIANLSVVHEDYHLLLKKLLDYENQFRQHQQGITSDIFVPLSSASSRLLLEFAMRYGIGELYRKIILLHCLTSEFSPSVGYLNYMNALMTSVQQMLPANKAALVIVKKELSILTSCLQVLKVQSCKALNQMKFIFSEKHPARGIDSLLSVLQTVLLIKQYLAPIDIPQETLTDCVTNTVQSMFQRTYDMFKVVALKDLEQCSTADMDPRLLNAVMEDIQEDVAGFKTNFESCFIQFFSISNMAASSYYQFLMSDVRELTHHRNQQQNLKSQIDLQMLGLVYRLNKLDTLWSKYIPLQQQVWRGYFLPCYFHWQDALQKHLQDIVLDAASRDAYRCQTFHLTHPLFTYQKSSSSSDRRSCTFSVISFSPSVNSAFSSFTSSVNSTPQQVPVCLTEEKFTQVHPSPEHICSNVDPAHSKTKFKHSYDSVSLNLEVNDPKNLVKFSITSCRSLPDNLHLLSISNGQDPGQATDQSYRLDTPDPLDFICQQGQVQGGRGLLPDTAFIPSLLGDLCCDEELSGDNNAELDQSDSEDFQFPPLKMVSQDCHRGLFNAQDFLKPVFSKSLSQDSLCHQGLQSPAHNIQESESGQDLHDSPDMQNVLHAVMPISGSVIDVVVILQRLCAFSGVLVAKLVQDPRAPPPALSTQVSVQPLDELDNFPVIAGNACDLPTVPETETIKLEQSSLKLKFLMHIHVFKTICQILNVYTINLLCMDLCGLQKNQAKKLIGLKLMDMVDKLNAEGMVRICRHHAESHHDCLYYHSSQGPWNVRHEQLTQQMCTRVNNVSACLDILEDYETKLLAAMSLNNIQILHLSRGDNADFGSLDFFGSILPPEIWPSWTDEEDNVKDIFNGSVSQALDYWAKECKAVVEQERQNLMLILTGQCRLLAYRLNLFIKDGLEAHVPQSSASTAIPSCLSTVTTFLQKYLDSFCNWLYHESFSRVLENIWIYIVQDFEKVASQLVKAGPSSWALAHTWMLTMIHFMKFLNNKGKGINRDLLLAQANRVLFHLELYTMSTVHLVALFQSLIDFHSTEEDGLTLDENSTKRPPAITHRILKELQSLRKSFSGAELVHWIIKNQNVLPADMNIPAEPLTKSSAQTICQSLLDQNFIVELSMESLTRRTTPVSFGQTAEFTSYPELVIHSSASQTVHFDRARCWSTAEMQEFKSNTSLEPRKASLVSNAETSVIKAVMSTSSLLAYSTQRPGEERGSRTRGSINTDASKVNTDHQTRHHSTPSRGSLQAGLSSGGIQVPDLYSSLTPFSSLSDIRTEENKNMFVASSHTFYLVRQSIFLPLHGTGQPITNTRPETALSETEQLINKLKESLENLALVERCFAHKLSPMVVLSIVACRKKTDRLAREFLKQVPAATLNKLKNVMDEPSLDCTSS